MCEPQTIVLGGALISGYGAYKEQKAQKDSIEYQQAEAEINGGLQDQAARDAMQRGKQAAQDHMRQVGQFKAEQTAVLAASGMDISQGTPASLLDDTQYMGDLDLRRIQQNAKREAWGYRVEAGNMRSTANMLGATADNINPIMGGILGAAGSVASNWQAFSGG